MMLWLIHQVTMKLLVLNNNQPRAAFTKPAHIFVSILIFALYLFPHKITSVYFAVMEFNVERWERERDLKLTSEVEMVEMFEFAQTLEQISCFGQVPGISMEVGDWT